MAEGAINFMIIYQKKEFYVLKDVNQKLNTAEY